VLSLGGENRGHEPSAVPEVRRTRLAARLRTAELWPGASVLSSGETLKAFGLSSRQVSNPRLLGLFPSAGLGKPFTWKQPPMTTTTKSPGEAQDAPLYVPTGLTPDELFEALGKLRREAQDEIERLIDLLDLTDPFFDEREKQIDDEPIDGDDDSEDTLGSVDHANQTRWASGDAGSREGDGCADDREGDELQHGGDEHDGAEPGEDSEPSLGWTEAHAQGVGQLGGWDDSRRRAIDGHGGRAGPATGNSTPTPPTRMAGTSILSACSARAGSATCRTGNAS
jgi:hypothetical protein